MSYRKEHILSLKPESESSYIAGESEESLKDLFKEILETGVHGFCFSLYEDGQKPGDIISEEQVRRRMEIIKPHAQWVRSFSCTEGNEWIPKVAKEMGIKTLVGAWLGDDPEINQREIEGLIQLAKDGFVDIAAVGNEVMYRKDLSEDELLEFIKHVKAEVPNIPVGYVDAYYEFSHRPRITEICDVILCNCYPFWEGCPFENSLDYMQQMYHQAKAAANGKEVIITETGWPSQGENLKGSMPSEKNARDYFINTQLWSANDHIPVFYFSSFDESWKVGAEGTVGAYWGIWDKQEKLKF
jgi:exo-beta-1,3-glucanase (GH17 family)